METPSTHNGHIHQIELLSGDDILLSLLFDSFSLLDAPPTFCLSPPQHIVPFMLQYFTLLVRKHPSHIRCVRLEIWLDFN